MPAVAEREWAAVGGGGALTSGAGRGGARRRLCAGLRSFCLSPPPGLPSFSPPALPHVSGNNEAKGAEPTAASRGARDRATRLAAAIARRRAVQAPGR